MCERVYADAKEEITTFNITLTPLQNIKGKGKKENKEVTEHTSSVTK